jgi:hypothetical protein
MAPNNARLFGGWAAAFVAGLIGLNYGGGWAAPWPDLCSNDCSGACGKYRASPPTRRVARAASGRDPHAVSPFAARIRTRDPTSAEQCIAPPYLAQCRFY